jgi:hypothetical protein
MKGWIKIHRCLLENPIYNCEPFDRTHAWIDLLLLANHKEGYFYKRGIRVDVKEGQVGYDIDSLGKRWKWSRGKVERFLNSLEKDENIVRQKNNVTTLISIVKYKEYQANDNANEHQTIKQTNTNKNVKNEKNEKEVILDSWIEYRKSAKKTLTQQSIKSILIKMENYTNEQCKFVINKSIEQGWQGLFWDNIQTIQEVNEPKKWKAPWS